MGRKSVHALCYWRGSITLPHPSPHPSNTRTNGPTYALINNMGSTPQLWNSFLRACCVPIKPTTITDSKVSVWPLYDDLLTPDVVDWAGMVNLYIYVFAESRHRVSFFTSHGAEGFCGRYFIRIPHTPAYFALLECLVVTHRCASLRGLVGEDSHGCTFRVNGTMYIYLKKGFHIYFFYFNDTLSSITTNIPCWPQPTNNWVLTR